MPQQTACQRRPPLSTPRAAGAKSLFFSRVSRERPAAARAIFAAVDAGAPAWRRSTGLFSTHPSVRASSVVRRPS